MNNNIAEIRLGTASCGIASGAGAVLEKLATRNKGCRLKKVSEKPCLLAKGLGNGQEKPCLLAKGLGNGQSSKANYS